MTNGWNDIKNADVITIMGGNAAEAHPCGFKWVTEAKAHNKAKLIVVDPRYTRSAAVSDLYCPIRQGSDIAWLGGLINYILENDKTQKEYTRLYTNAAFIVKSGYDFKGRAVRRLRRREARLQPRRLGVRAGRAGHGQGRPDAG